MFFSFTHKKIVLPALVAALLILGACMTLPTQPDAESQPTPASENPLLVYRGPAEMGSPESTMCASMLLDGSDTAVVGGCDGGSSQQQLGERTYAEWQQILKRFAPFRHETERERLDFAGQGDVASEPWQRALLAWARARHAELVSGRTSATISTAMSWHLGQAGDQENRCRHLTVLDYGYAQAEEVRCDSQEVLSTTGDWLTDAELAQLDLWLYQRAPLYVDDSYIDGKGTQEVSESEVDAVAAWAAALWYRMRGEGAAGNDGGVEPVLTWHREGGIAGFCDDVNIYADGRVTLYSCRGNPPVEVAQTQLTADQAATLNDWLTRLAPFKFEQSDPAQADAMTVRVNFAGQGGAEATDAEQQALLTFVQELVAQAEQPTSEAPTDSAALVDYTSQQGGFTIQYPSTALRFEGAEPSVDGAISQAPDTVSFLASEANYELTISWFELSGDGSLAGFVESSSQCAAITPDGGEPFQLDGRDGLLYADAPCGPFGISYIFTIVDGRGYRLAVESAASYAEVRQDVETVLATLRMDPALVDTSAPAACPQPADNQQRLVDGMGGYCLLYPDSYTAIYLPDGATELVTQSLMNVSDPRVSIHVVDANGRSLDEAADEWEAQYVPEGFAISRGSITVDGVEAVMLDNLPGQDLNRRVVLVHNGWRYDFFFTPLGEEGEARARMEAFYQGVLDSFTFLDETVPEPLPLPEAADVVDTDVQYVQALVNVNIRSGPGTNYGVVGSIFAGQTAQVTGAMPDGGWWRVICPDGSVGSCFVINDPSLTQPATPPDGNAPIQETGEAIVESLTVNILESFPVQVQAVVRGQLPDACSLIESTDVYAEGNTFRIRMTTARQPNQRCAPMPTPFEEVVALGATGLPAGEYDVRVNDLVTPFTLSTDNAPITPEPTEETALYEDSAAGFAFDYPATWMVSGGESGDRGALTLLSAPDGTRLDVSVLAWDPKNDLAAYVATRKVAWDASGITIVEEEPWILSSGQPAIQFVVRGADGSDGFFLFTALDERYLTLSGSGNLDALDAIGKSLRIVE